LSIQVHPSAAGAREGYAREEAAGLPLDAPERSFRDIRPKPELASPLTPFYLLHGFRPVAEIAGLPVETPEFAPLAGRLQSGDLERIYTRTMTLPQGDVDGRLAPLLGRILPAGDEGRLTRDSPDFWAARAAKAVPASGGLDRGIFSIYLFN